MFEDIYIFYVLSKYKLNLISRLELFTQFKEYVKSKGPIFIKLLQIFLINSYKYGDEFSEEEINKLNEILDKVHYEKENADFDVGCGSVAYVYFDKEDRNKVIKKVLPDIENEIESSTKQFKNMCYMANIVMNLPYDEKGIDDYKEILLKQAKLDKEAENMIRMKKTIVFNNVIIPKVYEYNENMIKMEYVEGIKLSEFICKYPDKKEECYSLLFCLISEMIHFKFLHGDLHEGNFMFKLNDKNHVIVSLIDFGIVCEISDEQRNIFKQYIFKGDNKEKFYYEMTKKSTSLAVFSKIYNKYKDGNFFVLIDKMKENNVEINYKFIIFLISLHNLKVRLEKLKKKN